MSKNSNILNISGWLIFGALVVGVGGCAATVIGAGAGTAVAVGMDSRSGGGVIDDQTLEHDVNNVLSAQVPNGSFTVASHGQRVLLAGQVPTQADKDKAALAATNTAGVKKVWNYLTISVNETVGDISHDTYLTSLAKSRLIGQKGVNTNNIKVVTCSDVVYLLGDNKSAGEPSQIAGGIKGIESISGVKKVVNLISTIDTSKKSTK
ncbi:MAG: hemolysin [Burkholderiales bacterium]|jgi:osmotically-inducible protein OsmY|nr:hemolysin [Burkholderiales bacterium]